MLHERLRLLTFDKKWTKTSQNLSAENMAKDGFVFASEPDIVRCVFCSVCIGDWEQNDVVANEHAKFSPNCRRKGNITIEDENYDNNILRLYEERYLSFTNMPEDLSVQGEWFEKLPPHHLHCYICKPLTDRADYFARNGYFLHNYHYLQCVFCKYIIVEPFEKVMHTPFCIYYADESKTKDAHHTDEAKKSQACSIM